MMCRYNRLLFFIVSESEVIFAKNKIKRNKSKK